MQPGMIGKVDLPVEERLDHIEGVLPNLARLAFQQQLESKMSEMESFLKVFVEGHEALKDNLQEVAEEHLHAIKSLSVSNKSLIGSLDSFVKKSEQTNSLISQIQKDVLDLFSQKSSLASQISNLASDMNNNPRFAGLEKSCTYLTSDLAGLAKDHSELKEKIESLRLSHVSLVENGENISKKQSSHKNELNVLKDRLSGLEDVVVRMRSELLDFCTSSNKKLSQDFSKAITNLPQPDVISLDSVKNEFVKQLEPASFDAKNANLRSSNNESKIVILEKKVEQLYLLLNKYDLNK